MAPARLFAGTTPLETSPCVGYCISKNNYDLLCRLVHSCLRTFVMAAFRRGFRLSGQVLRASTWKRQCVAPRSIGGRLLHRDCAASHASVALRAFSSSVHTQDPSKSAATRTPLPNVGRRGHELSQTLKSATSWRDAIVAFRRACGRDADTAQSMGLADVTGLRFREANVRNLCTCFYRVCHLLPNRGQDHLAQDSDLLWLLDEGFTRLRTAIDTAAHGSKLDISGTPIAMLMRDLAWSRLAMASPQGKHLFSALVVAAETRLNGMSLRELADVATALSVRRNAAPALTSAITQAALEGMEDTDMRTAARLLRALASVHDQAALKPLAEACTDVVLGALESAPPTVLAPHLPAIVSAFASIRPSSTSEVLNLALQRASRDVLPLMPKSKAIHLAFMLRPEVGVSALQSPLLAHATHHGTADLTDADLVSLCSVFHPKNVSNTRAFLEATFEEVVLRASAQKAGSFRMVLQWLALVRTARLVDDMQRQVSMVLRRLKFPRTRVSAKQLESLMSAVAMVPGNHSALLQGLGDQVMRRCSRDASGSGSMEQPIPADMAKVVVRAVWTMVHGCDGARSVPLDLLSHDLVELALTSMASDTPAMDVGVGSLGLL